MKSTNPHQSLTGFKLLVISASIMTTLSGWVVIAIKRPPPAHAARTHERNQLLASIALAAPPAPVADTAASR